MEMPDSFGAIGGAIGKEVGGQQQIIDNIKAIGSSMEGFAAGAKAGKFAVNETGGQALLDALDSMD
ncbi:MAG: hypothetical protein GEU98_29535, partial [Pseudonocardiaceae bacterium]|nr:hypothetical protein [Pseudonocardiaceae bacterium]